MKTHFHTTVKLALALFFSLVFGLNAQAQRLQSHVLELQNRIEAQIDRNLTNLISTQLAPTTFDVSTRVKVVEVPPVPPKPDKKVDLESMPAGMDLGSVDVREVIDSYRKQIEELKAFKETQQKIEEPKFSVTSIEVVVGLSDIYDDAYVAQFKDWLTARVKKDYGANATALVNKAKPLPIKETPGLNWRDFLPMVAYALLALSLVIAAWLLSRGLIKLGEGAKSIVIEHKNTFSVDHHQRLEQKAEEKRELLGEGQEGAGGGLLDFEEDKDEELDLLQAGEELIGKITFLCLELGKGVNDLVRFWLDNGNEGYLKTAVLVDMIVTLKEKVSAETEAANHAQKHKYPQETAVAITTLKIPLDTDLASAYGVNLSEAYREAAAMTPEAKLDFLEKIYWDLLQIRTIGAQNMRKPFDYLQSMNDMAFAEALKTQPDDTKALALMFGDPQKTKVFMSSISDTEKEKIVANMMGLTQVSKKQIWDVDTSMKLKLINSTMNPEESLVNLFPRTIDMLNSLSPVDEIKVLRKTVVQMPDGGVTVKQQLTSLAFIDQWHEEYVAKLVKVSTSAELVQLLTLIPEARNIVLGACPDKMRMIIEDDLSMATPDDALLAKSIKQLKGRWKQICASENIAMGNVINFERNNNWMKNAG